MRLCDQCALESPPPQSRGLILIMNKSISYKVQKKMLIGGFLVLPMLLFFTFTLLPVINMFLYSFQEWRGLGNNHKFVGLANYFKMFSSMEYFSVFKVSLYYFAGSFVQLGLALLFATILNNEVKGQGFFKGVLFFPYLMNGVAIGFIFLIFFQPGGTLDTVLSLLGIDSQLFWLRDPRLINISLSGTSVWRYMGFNFVIFLGAIQSILPEIYEAASIDGANSWHKFVYIILPSIKPIVQLNLILAINGALSVFEIPYIMTGGNNGSETFVIKTVNTAFKYNKFGMASTMAIVLFLLVIVVTGFQRLMAKRWEER